MTLGRRRKATKKHPRPVAVVTGTRAEYGLMQSTLEAVQRHPALTLQLIVTGTHLLRSFGYTVQEIVRDGWSIDRRVKMQNGRDDRLDAAEGLSRGVAGIARFLESANSEVVVVLGDRVEAMAGALAGACTGRFVAHIHGGDVAPGDQDEGMRHAVTKLAHVHLTATRQAARRIVRMGEPLDRVHVVGAPGLDRLFPLVSGDRSRRRRSGRALVVYHPCGRKSVQERRTMQAVLDAVDALQLSPTIVYPNSDRGYGGVVAAIEGYRRKARSRACRVYRSLPRRTFLKELIEADVLVGNSSSGIIEAATAGTPAVNVGLRQEGRQRNGRSIVDADETFPSVVRALRLALRKRPISGRAGVYGNGQAGVRIAKMLAEMPLEESFRRKKNRY